MKYILFLLSGFAVAGNCEIVQTGKFFAIPLEPALFNWTTDATDEFKYTPSLVKSPDLPEWMQYLYSRRDRKGYLYGVVPPDYKDFDILVIGMNQRTYETGKRVVHLNVLENPKPGTHQVNLKIDNINVEDLFDPFHMTRLLDIFRDKLWPKSFGDLYVSFLTSAVTQGARRPLKPNEGEGVVIRLSSTATYSTKLLDLQEELKPLWKMQSCPRDFKRTSVERWFRDVGFILDWCSFKLVGAHRTDESPADWLPPADMASPAWLEVTRSTLPARSYGSEVVVTVLIPTLLLVILVFMLSFVLCFSHEGVDDEMDKFVDNLCIPCEEYEKRSHKEGETEEQMTHYVAVLRATSTLRSLSAPRDVTHPTLVVATNEDVTRPTPPPYTGTLRQNKGDM